MSDVIPHRPYPDLLVPPVNITPRLYLTDATKSFMEVFDVAKPYEVEVTCNTDAEHTWTVSIGVLDPDRVQPLVDYVYLEVEAIDAVGSMAVVPMGHYLCDQPERRFDGKTLTGRIIAYSNTLALEQSTMGSSWTLHIGDDPALELQSIIVGAGIAESMVNVTIPSTIVASEEKTYYASENRKKIGNELADKLGYYAPYSDGHGTIHSHPYHNYGTVPVAATLGTIEGTLEILEPLSHTVDRMRLRNRVTVIKMQEPTESEPDRTPIIATAEVTDYSHPLHPVRLQEARHAPSPVILGERIEDSEIETYEVALAKAKDILVERSSMYETTRVVHVIDRAPGPHQVVELDVRWGLDPVYEGRWLRRSWTYRQSGSMGFIESNLSRYVQVG